MFDKINIAYFSQFDELVSGSHGQIAAHHMPRASCLPPPFTPSLILLAPLKGIKSVLRIFVTTYITSFYPLFFAFSTFYSIVICSFCMHLFLATEYIINRPILPTQFPSRTLIVTQGKKEKKKFKYYLELIIIILFQLNFIINL